MKTEGVAHTRSRTERERECNTYTRGLTSAFSLRFPPAAADKRNGYGNGAKQLRLLSPFVRSSFLRPLFLPLPPDTSPHLYQWRNTPLRPSVPRKRGGGTRRSARAQDFMDIRRRRHHHHRYTTVARARDSLGAVPTKPPSPPCATLMAASAAQRPNVTVTRRHPSIVPGPPLNHQIRPPATRR